MQGLLSSASFKILTDENSKKMIDNKYEANDDLVDSNGVYYNKFKIANAKDLATLEQIIVTNKLLTIKDYPQGDFSLKHLCMIHEFLFTDLYTWAGELRQVDITKGSTTFCHVDFIVVEFNKLYQQIQKDGFLKSVSKDMLPSYLANYYSELNMLHPFREGNGRVLRAYLALMVFHSHQLVLNYHNLNTTKWLQASINSTILNNKDLQKIFKIIVESSL